MPSTLGSRSLGAPGALLATAILALFAVERLGFLEPYRDIDGRRLPHALATVDHPFHAARFATLLRSLGEGEPLRWVASHQGGYPSEFYPFGAAIVDLAVWLVTFGALPGPLVHTYAVAVVFLLPLVAFLGLARVAQLPLWSGVLGGAIHLSVRGWWWSGGSMELIEWGLVTNVAAATLLLLALAPAARLVTHPGPGAGAAFALLVALAILTNPRSAVAAGAIVVAWLVVSAMDRIPWRQTLRALGIPLVLAALLSAPLWVSLLRYRDLYYFVHYSGYEGFRPWLDSSLQAVSGPVFVAAALATAIGLLPAAPAPYRLVAAALLVYVGLTLWLVEVRWPASFVEQLETTRLMPVQRLLMIAVVGLGAGWLVQRSGRRFVELALPAAAILVPVLYVVAPPDFIPEGDRGLVRIGTFADPSLADLETSVRLADEVAPGSSAILILGSSVSWHSQLWAPVWTERRIFADDWLWYWQREHVGDYNPAIANAYRSDASTLNETYLRTHGIGAVVVTGDAEATARASNLLELRRDGIYDVYSVVIPTGMATVDERPVRVVEDSGERIEVATDGATGELILRTNWFPRWSAAADGEEIPVRHRADGYLSVQVPEETASVTFIYRVTWLDWAARAAAVLGGLGCLALLVGWTTPTARSALRSRWASRGRALPESPR